MTRKVTVVLFSAILFLGGSSTLSFAAGTNAQEGEWENTTEMKMEGVSFAIPPVTVRHCVTKENLVPEGSQKGDQCKIKDQRIVGNKVTWSVECVGKDTRSESQGEITYSGDNYKGTVKTKFTDKTGKTMASTGTMTGRRIGECTDKTKRTVWVGGREVQKPDPVLMEQAKKAQEDYEKYQKEQKARWEELARISVPEEDAGSCALSAENFNDPNCESKVGKLNLNPGEWEITTQEGVDQMGNPVVSDPKKTTQCLTLESPMISAIEKSAERKAARSSQKITWILNKTSPAKMDERGGIIYKGDTLEGVILRAEQYGGSAKIVRKTKISGHRIGDGKTCLAKGRAYTSKGREFTSKKRGILPGAGELPNPAKELRKIFGF